MAPVGTTAGATQQTGPSDGAIARASSWVKANKQTVLIALGVTTVVAGGAGYYYYQSASGSSAAARKEEKKARKAAKRKQKRGPGGGAAGSAERKSAETSEAEDAAPTKEKDPSDPLNMSKADLEAIPAAQRSKLALDLKNRGNKAYSEKRYSEAIELYSKAIDCEEQAVFYSNRAACYNNMDNFDAVIRDCTDALRLDKTYLKALHRRATARETIGGEDNLYEALIDFTACVILDEFKNDSKGQAAERVMRRLATEKAQRIIASREPRLPSSMIIRAYLDAFRPRLKPSMPESPSQGDKTLSLAYDALSAFDYPHAMSLFSESLEQGISTTELQAQAHTMKGTFLFLMGQAQSALEELDTATSLVPDLVQAWVKKASVHMELAQPEEAMKDFDRAQGIDDRDGDVYYHRGQVFNVTEQHLSAIEEYRKSAELDPDFIFSHVQLAVAHYKTGAVQKALALFERYVARHPDSPEVHNYYGELLFAEKDFDKAIGQFEKAAELEERKNGPKNVLPLVNKALVIATGRNDMAQAEVLCAEALEQDPTCEVAVQQLAQMKLQSNKIPEAVEWFGKGAELAMTEPGLASSLQFEAAARAQLAFIRNYPEQAQKFGLAAQ